MKIAVSGSHCTGKTTLVEELHRALPAYVTVDEPYCLMAEEGHEFAAMPDLQDFECQLERSIQLIADSEEKSIFDRCPADMLAYLLTHRDSQEFEVETWLPRSRGAMERLDLVVYVPIEQPDRILFTDTDDGNLRDRVDEELREILIGDRWGIGTETLEVTGSEEERLRQVLIHVPLART